MTQPISHVLVLQCERSEFDVVTSLLFSAGTADCASSTSTLSGWLSSGIFQVINICQNLVLFRKHMYLQTFQHWAAHQSLPVLSCYHIKIIKTFFSPGFSVISVALPSVSEWICRLDPLCKIFTTACNCKRHDDDLFPKSVICFFTFCLSTPYNSHGFI